MGTKKDRFDQKTTWITRLTLDKPFELHKPTFLCVLIAQDGFEIKSKMFPDNDHKQLYQHAGITVSKEPVTRFVNAQETIINEVAVKLLQKGLVLEYKSDSARKGHDDYAKLEKELLRSGIYIAEEKTERCEKEGCKIK